MHEKSARPFALLSNCGESTAQKIFYRPVIAGHRDESRVLVDLLCRDLTDQTSRNVWSTETNNLDTIKRIAKPVHVVDQVPAHAARLIAAGPQDLLIAHQKAPLHVFHSAS